VLRLVDSEIGTMRLAEGRGDVSAGPPMAHPTAVSIMLPSRPHRRYLQGPIGDLCAYTNRHDSEYLCCLGEMAHQGQKSYQNRRRGCHLYIALTCQSPIRSILENSDTMQNARRRGVLPRLGVIELVRPKGR
jgi:hypothetical protein